MPTPTQNGASTSGPFSQHALDLWERGLCPLPCGGEKGKAPLVRWKAFQNTRPPWPVLEGWLGQHPATNIGVLTGPAHGLTVVDIDSRETPLPAHLTRFGETPLVVRTGRGWHLYYASTGEHCQTGLGGRAGIDVRGVGGFVVVPPSENPETGTLYTFEHGGWDDLPHLPNMRPEAIEDVSDRARGAAQATERPEGAASPAPSAPASPPAGLVYEEGERHNALLHALLPAAREAADRPSLQHAAQEMNTARCRPPLPAEEVAGIAHSLWQYRQDGRLFAPNTRGVVLEERLIYDLPNLYPPAVLLLVVLRCEHFSHAPHPPKTFALAVDGMAARMGWSKPTVRKARDALLHAGYIQRVHAGGRGPHDPALYQLR